MSISVLIINFNEKKLTDLCLQSLKGQTEQDFEVIVLENGSREGERAKGEGFKNLILNKNYGFPFAVNLGVKTCQNDWILVLNNDCVLEPNFLEEMKKTVEENPELKVFSPKIYQANSKKKDNIDSGFRRNDNVDYQKKVEILYACGDDIDEKGLARNIGRDEVDKGQYDNQKTVPLATFACILIKKEVLANFPLEEEYFGYYEDVDFCLRLKKAGLKICFVPKAVCFHIGEASFKKLDNLDNEMRQFKNLSLTVMRNFTFLNIVRHYLIFNLKSFRYYFLMKKKWKFLKIELQILIELIK